jgi:hypothetical protein
VGCCVCVDPCVSAITAVNMQVFMLIIVRMQVKCCLVTSEILDDMC